MRLEAGWGELRMGVGKVWGWGPVADSKSKSTIKLPNPLFLSQPSQASFSSLPWRPGYKSGGIWAEGGGRGPRTAGS